ncbi:hypothetical protein ACSZM0_20855 [Aeromonas hydrophila]
MFKNDVLDVIRAPIKAGDVMAFDNNAEVVDLNRPIFEYKHRPDIKWVT